MDSKRYFIYFLYIIIILIPLLFFIKHFSLGGTMTTQFKVNKTEMECLANILLQNDSESIYISKSMGISGLANTKEYQKTKNLAYNLIDRQNLMYIEKYQQTVFFCYKSRLMTGIGIAYTSNGKNPKSRSGDMISVKKIDSNWFYCELD